ncbi:MAG TPA: hypothetical protein ENI37_08160, partial [Chloroflexi bacterium]|nr:hypothetical protein [Chloroflexota bacterium]
MKQVGRIVAFVLALAAVGVIVGGALWAGRRTGGIGVSACSVGSPEEVVLESYIQLHAEDLQ